MADTDDTDASDNSDDTDGIPETFLASGGPNREAMANSYLPGEEEYSAKTHLHINDPARVAALRNWDKIFPSRAHQQDLIDGYTTEFLRSRPSAHGVRRELKEIIMSFFGRSGGDDDDGKALKLVADDGD